jgi:UDP-N-acetylmuramoyl-L-alanyl-D-glutamate--2,6-diaminopimelate ligase
MTLESLLRVLPEFELRGPADFEIRSIELDSRRVGGGALFVCLEGLASDGHDFAAAAVNQGAVALLARRPVDAAATQVLVRDTREAMARLAGALYGFPSRSLRLVGVTGTNGKTTLTHVVKGLAEEAGEPAEVMGTLGSSSEGGYRSTGFTTPEAPELQRLLREAVDRGTRWIAMEVSSHALAQKRTFGTDFAAVVFTNLTRDHLDFHGDMRTYFEAKALLFDRASRGSEREAVAVINFEDAAGRELARRATGKVVSYGFAAGVDYRAEDVRSGPGGTLYTLVTPRGAREVRLPLLGGFNVLNALGAQAAVMEAGLPLDAAAVGVRRVPQVRGRMEAVRGAQPFLVLIDYAHTPDALAHALETTRGLAAGRLTVVFGCGGDRDRGKRPEMGAVAARLADRMVVTTDNPRHEDPQAILDAILAGVREGHAEVWSELDRETAIRRALAASGSGDAVLIAGKGHEDYQIIGDERRPFDDREVAARLLGEIGFHVDDTPSGV